MYGLIFASILLKAASEEWLSKNALLSPVDVLGPQRGFRLLKYPYSSYGEFVKRWVDGLLQHAYLALVAFDGIL